MTRLNFVLVLAVLASALYLVRTQYESRRLYVELEKAGAQSRRLDTERDRLQVEKRSQATPLRVERLAKERLQMRTATPAITQYVTYRDGVVTLPAVVAPAVPAASAAGARR
ncbi:MAG: cell division protein FtsL [Polaromonas sp.]|nr:cell division protein FtsL [Polaromonas sp.]